MAFSDGAKSAVSFTRPANQTPYNAGAVVGPAEAALVFANVAFYASRPFIITGVTLEIDAAAVPAGMSTFKLHLYDASPTAIADNAAYDLPAGDRAKYLGYITLAAPVDLGATLWSQNDNLNFNGKLSSVGTSIYGILTTDGAYTPTSECVKKITLYIVGV